jgi:hypothetical protein
MAMESACKLQVGKDRYDGKVRMEADHIDFAGQTKFRFRLTEIRNPQQDSEAISFGFHGHAVQIGLGNLRTAESWINYILHPQTLADKLGLRDGQSIRVQNIDDPELMSSLEGKKVKIVTNGVSRCDMVVLGVERASELRQVEDLMENLKLDGVIWVVLQKTLRTVTKANVVATVREAGLAHEGVIDYSESHAAHRIMRPLGQRKRPAGGNGAAHATTARATTATR